MAKRIVCPALGKMLPTKSIVLLVLSVKKISFQDGFRLPLQHYV